MVPVLRLRRFISPEGAAEGVAKSGVWQYVWQGVQQCARDVSRRVRDVRFALFGGEAEAGGKADKLRAR